LRLDRVRAREGSRGAAARLLDVEVEVDALSFGGLDRRPERVISEPVVAGGRPAHVRYKGDRRHAGDARLALRRIEVRARLVDGRTPARDGAEEPDPVLHERAAELRARAINVLHLGARIDPVRAQ